MLQNNIYKAKTRAMNKENNQTPTKQSEVLQWESYNKLRSAIATLYAPAAGTPRRIADEITYCFGELREEIKKRLEETTTPKGEESRSAEETVPVSTVLEIIRVQSFKPYGYTDEVAGWRYAVEYEIKKAATHSGESLKTQEELWKDFYIQLNEKLRSINAMYYSLPTREDYAKEIIAELSQHFTLTRKP